MDTSINLSGVADGAETPAAWPAIISLSIGVFGLVTAEFLPASLLTPMSQDLGVSVGAAGQTVTVTALVAAVAGPGIVIGTSRFDRRHVLIALTSLLVVSSIVAAFANSLPVLLLSRFLLGIGLGGFWAMSVALAMRLAPPSKIARAMSIVMAGVSGATVCAAPIGAWIGSTLGWRYAFFMAAAVGVLALAIQVLTVPSLPSRGTANLGTLAAMLRRPAIRLCLGTVLLAVTGHFAGFTYVRPFLEDVPRLDVGAISETLLAFGIAGFFGNLVGGYIAGQSTRLAIGSAASGIAVTTLVLAFMGVSPTLAAVATALWGFSFGALPVSVQTFVTKAAPDDTESAGALLITTFMIAISSGAIVGGLLVDSIGAYGVFVFAGVSALLGAGLISSSSRVSMQPA